MAIRFGGKSVGGFALGVLALWRGARSPVLGSVLLVGLDGTWLCPFGSLCVNRSR